MKNELFDFVLRGRRDFFHTISAYSPLPGASFEDHLQTIIYCSGIDFAPCNGVISDTANDAPTKNEIEQMIEFFTDKKMPFIWWSTAKILENYDFEYGGSLTGIALSLPEYLRFKPSKTLIKVVQSEADLKTFTEISAISTGMTKNAESQFLAVNEAIKKQDNHVHFLAYLNETPVGVATLTTHSHSAGVWNLATLPEYRKKGIGQALVEAALIEAKKRHYNQVMAILMPKGMAWGIFNI